MKPVARVIDALVAASAHKATLYVTASHVIRATRRLFGRKISKRDNIDIVLTIGRPNYLERRFIKQAKKAGVPFPVKKVQLRFPPKKRAA
jgi:hypothetical protein